METINIPMSLRDLSHELRTPLTGILGMAYFLKQETLTRGDLNATPFTVISFGRDLFERPLIQTSLYLPNGRITVEQHVTSHQ